MSGRDSKGRFVKGHKQLVSKEQLKENSKHVSGYWKGKKRDKETVKKMSDYLSSRTGKDAIRWKGDEVGYSGLHMYIRKKFGKPSHCEMCGTKEDRQYHWARKTNTNSRDKIDWMRLCVPCHKKYDTDKRKK